VKAERGFSFATDLVRAVHRTALIPWVLMLCVEAIEVNRPYLPGLPHVSSVFNLYYNHAGSRCAEKDFYAARAKSFSTSAWRAAKRAVMICRP